MSQDLIIKWHRLFGIALEQDFIEYSVLHLDREKDLSRKEQLLDVLIVYTDSLEKLTSFLANPPKPLPDGLDNLSQHNLITYKSLREPLNEWTLQELVGHYVNYRKNLSDQNDGKLHQQDLFQLYAICTRFPRKLMVKYSPKEIQSGIYEIDVLGKTVRIIVLSRIPKAKQNAIWNIFSNVVENIEYGTIQYGSKLEEMSSVFDRLFQYYNLEGIHVAYSFEQFEKEYFLDKATELIQDEEVQPGLLDTVFQYLSLDKILSRLLGDEQGRKQAGKKFLSYFSASERLEGLSPDERLEGLSPDEIKAYMKKLDDDSI